MSWFSEQPLVLEKNNVAKDESISDDDSNPTASLSLSAKTLFKNIANLSAKIKQEPNESDIQVSSCCVLFGEEFSRLSSVHLSGNFNYKRVRSSTNLTQKLPTINTSDLLKIFCKYCIYP